MDLSVLMIGFRFNILGMNTLQVALGHSGDVQCQFALFYHLVKTVSLHHKGIFPPFLVNKYFVGWYLETMEMSCSPTVVFKHSDNPCLNFYINDCKMVTFFNPPFSTIVS